MEAHDIQQNLLLKEALSAYEGVTATAAIVIHTQLNLDREKADAEIKIGICNH